MTDETKALESRVRQDLTMLTHAYDRTVDAQAARIAALEAALRFYANPEIYKPHPHGPGFDNRDVSYVARAALASGATPPDDVD